MYYIYIIENSPFICFGLFCADPLIPNFSIIFEEIPLFLDLHLIMYFIFLAFSLPS